MYKHYKGKQIKATLNREEADLRKYIFKKFSGYINLLEIFPLLFNLASPKSATTF